MAKLKSAVEDLSKAVQKVGADIYKQAGAQSCGSAPAMKSQKLMERKIKWLMLISRKISKSGLIWI